MAKTTVKDLSIKDRKKLLDEAIDFFLALGKEREDMDYLLFKAAALKGVKKSYEYIAKDVMEKELETDEDVKTATHILL
jgi:predicted membrane GTPase involved in stress response